MPRELLNANITHVSYVDKGANQKKFFLTKSEEKPVFEKEVKIITKSEDDAQKLVYGVVYAPDEVDAHGDFMTADEIEKAAHQFLKDARNIDKQHNFESGAGEVVESYVAPTDMQIGEETITKGSWVLVTKATEEIWDSIQKGEITGYSMAGVAETKEVAKEEEHEQSRFFKMLKDFFVKGEVKDKFHDGKKQREFRDAYFIFDDVFWSEIWSNEPNIDRIKEAAVDFGELLIEIANAPDVLKALGDIKKEEGALMKISKEELQALLKEELAPVTAKLEALEKAQGEAQANNEQGNEDGQNGDDVQKSNEAENQASAEKEELLKALKEVIKEEVAPLSQRLETVEKARGVSQSIDNGGEVTSVDQLSPEGQSIFKSLFTYGQQ